ncbi:pyridoxal phosphate-dependent aminotransferase [Selenomonadales bacterium OttesenSCG-928-I06]|nr:pyridoxal phosphate-dependent aminotransferase [Selenomonadales bacterium OttesenSCG-928-I06]
MFNFNKQINRRNTNCLKWDYLKETFGTKDILPMWVADMDFPAPPKVIEALTKEAAHGVYGYSVNDINALKSFLDWLNAKYSWQVKPADIIHTPGVVTGLNLAIQCFTKKNDGVIIQTPVYNHFFDCITNNNRNLILNPLKYEEDTYKIDFIDLEEKIISSHAKMLIFCSPHNPVGRVWKKHELIQLLTLCQKHDVIIVSDEIHSDLVFQNHQHIPLNILDRNNNNKIITFMAPSKTFNLAGLKSAVAIITHEKLKTKFKQTVTALSLQYMNSFSSIAFENAYKYGDEWLQKLLIYLDENAEYISTYLEKNLKKIKYQKPEGTYLAWLDFREYNLSSEELNKILLEKAKLGLSKGTYYGKEGEGFMRLNFACSRDTLKDGLDRIKIAFS